MGGMREAGTHGNKGNLFHIGGIKAYEGLSVRPPSSTGPTPAMAAWTVYYTLSISKTYNITVQASSSAEARRIVEAMFAGSDIRVNRVSGAGE